MALEAKLKMKSSQSEGKRSKKEQPVSTACGFYKVKQYNHQKKVTVNITTTDTNGLTDYID